MTPRMIPVDVFDLVVFGATGDLAQRKLLPALFHRDLQGQIQADTRIIGTSRRAMTNAAFKAFALAAIEAYVAADLRTPEMTKRFLARLSYVAAEALKKS
jgi:glucose-6-phosphate 1-dehydrogenase